MENVKTAMTTREGVGGGEPLCLIHHTSQITDLHLYPPSGAISFKLCPKYGGFSGANPSPILGKSKRIRQFILVQ